MSPTKAVVVDGSYSEWTDVINTTTALPFRDGISVCPILKATTAWTSDVFGAAYSRWSTDRLCFLLLMFPQYRIVARVDKNALVIGELCSMTSLFRLNTTIMGTVYSLGKWIDYNKAVGTAQGYELCLPPNMDLSPAKDYYVDFESSYLKLNSLRRPKTVRAGSTGGDAVKESCRILKHRPTPTPTQTPAPTPSYLPGMATPKPTPSPTPFVELRLTDVISDPHVASWDGTSNMMFESGDYVMLHSAAAGVKVHVRFCFNGIDARAPYTCAIALQCGHHTGHVEVYPDNVTYHTNDRSHFRTQTFLDEFHGGVEVRCANVNFGLLVMRQRSHKHFHLDLRAELAVGELKDAVGLSGSPDDNLHNDVMTRDGLQLTLAPTMITEYTEENEALTSMLSPEDSMRFQRSWQVREEEKLFQTAFPDHDEPVNATYGKSHRATKHGHHSAERAQIAVEHAQFFHSRQSSPMLLEGAKLCKTAGVPASRLAICAREWVASRGNVEHIHNLLRFYKRFPAPA